jgi:Skp family chaperone for outer membrane proteins
MSQQYQKQKEKWFNAGKSQATKEILEEVDKIIKKVGSKMRTYPYSLLLDSDRNKYLVKFEYELKQQLKKLGEEGS